MAKVAGTVMNGRFSGNVRLSKRLRRRGTSWGKRLERLACGFFVFLANGIRNV